MSLDSLAKLLLPAVEEQLHRVIDRAFTKEYSELQTMLSYHLGWEGIGAGPETQGKRIRPLLLLLCRGSVSPGEPAATGSSDWKSALPAAAAVELIHNFSLIHDDIQDHSPLRRGRPTLWKTWGIPQAINAGDTMFSLAQLSILDLAPRVDHELVVDACRRINQTCLELTQGQFLDLNYEKEPVISLEAYWRMIAGKTAALLATCATLGAILGGAEGSTVKSFRDYGHNLGMAFQAQDDFLGMWGDLGQIGKSNLSDLVTGKKTLPVLYGLNQNKSFGRRWKMGPITENEAPEIAKLLAVEGARDYTENTVSQLTQQAMSALDRAMHDNNEYCVALKELTLSLLHRKI